MRAVWVVEWQAEDDRWFPFGSNALRVSRSDAWKAMRIFRDRFPGDWFRVVKYVPAPAKKPVQGGSRGR